MITTKKGDLLHAKEKIIAHQVNCFGAAGGLAAAVFDKYPVAEQDYQQLVQRMKPKRLLGKAILTGQQPDGHIVANIFGQYHPGADYRPDALRDALKQLAAIARSQDWSVAIPYKLSCGICGGDWNEVHEILRQTMRGVDCVIYRREGDK